MVERLVLVNHQKMNYEGIFSLQEIYSVIDKLIKNNSYTKREITNTEVVKKDGRFITIIIEPWRRLSDYAKSVITIKMVFENIKDVEIKKEGIQTKVNQGEATIIFNACLETDFEHRWENTPGFFFVRVLFDKYIFKPFTTDYQSMVMKDFKMFANEIRATLNLHKY